MFHFHEMTIREINMGHWHLSIASLLLLCIVSTSNAGMDDCVLRDGTSQRCLPPFVNAAYGRTVIASNTCGSPREEYCLQTGVTGVTTSCHICDSSDPSKRHDATFLTDFNDEDLSTWWQSSTMQHEVQYPNMVNLTLNLDKAFDITYVRLRFHTSRPESFAIYKKKCEDCEWQPFQYYSGSCFSTYGIDNKEIVTVEDEQKALCTDDFSDISPLTGGNVAFSTLESRPSAYNFDRSPVLQDWVKAVAIKIALNRINTFGDEVFQDPNILRSYYYAISDLSVGGRCACNGHASECYVGRNNVLTCRCQHNTAGRDCERCADFYNDRPWARATRDNPAVCEACDCNGMSRSCYFDAELYRRTGHGGHCTGCRDNTDGPHCEYCKPYHYRDSNNRCKSCECNEIGSNSQQCDSRYGECICKPGVGGPRCDQCLEGYYGLSEAGCRPCLCSFNGTVEGTVCDSDTGNCVCKLNVEGMRCDRCKPSTMNLQASNPYGCTSCFCYGHSSVCEVSDDYTVAYILSEFTNSNEGWQGRNYYNNPSPLTYSGGNIAMRPDNYYLSYFVAPDKFLGVQQFSYNQMLEFELWVEQLPNGVLDVGSGADSRGGVPLPSREDVVLEGEGFKVVASITSQGNPIPGTQHQLYRFRLHEAAGFNPRLTPLDFQKMLNNLDTIKIRSTYGEGLMGHLDNVQLKTAEREGSGPKADWVEKCDLDGYQGDFGNECAPGYTRDPPGGGVYAQCVPCNCNGHSDTCDPETGVCRCQHNTMGDHCELCRDGYYFGGEESRRGTPQECQPCPCPRGSTCAVTSDLEVVCTNCPPGHAGKQCEQCVDGWFGDPRGRGPCLRCACNGNIDENAVMNCNRTTGECLKCIYNTTGFHCEDCLPGYFGKPVTNNPAERCRLCECNSMGSRHMGLCNAATGQCQCLPNVEGRQCDHCRKGFWNIESGQGCESCNCNQIGTSTGECDEDSGQCDCRPGVGGQRCDRCLPNYYGLSGEGCQACNCNPDGSVFLRCGEDGKCVCKDGVLGVKCDECQENYYDIASGCIECPTCYGLVQNAVEIHRDELNRLENLEEQIRNGTHEGTPQGDEAFADALRKLNETAYQIRDMAKENQEKEEALLEQMEETLDNLKNLLVKLMGSQGNIDECNTTVQQANELNMASKNHINLIRQSLSEAQAKLNKAMDDLTSAQEIADDSLSKENNMSRIAQEAEALADRHQMQEKEITKTAQNALDTSRRARDSIQEAIDSLDDLSSTLEDLMESESKIPAARTLRDDLIAQSSRVRDAAESAKNVSTDLYTEASKLTVPTVDTEDMDSRSRDIQSEAEALMPRIAELDAEYKNNFAELKADFDKADNLMDTAGAAQSTVDMLLAQAHGALLTSQDAVSRGTAAYNAVLETKKTLQSFDQEINSNRQNAKDALHRIDEIQQKIDNATETTAQARESLGTARDIATQANNKAQQALDTAESIQKDAQKLRQGAIRSHETAGRISQSVSDLSDSLDETETRLQQAEQQAKDDKEAVSEATDAASQASIRAKDSKNRVDNILQQLQNLNRRLSSQRDVSDDDIAALEAEYEKLRRRVDAADIPDLLADLRAQVARLHQIEENYDKEIAELKKDIANLEEIRDAIPTECSRNQRVEQP